MPAPARASARHTLIGNGFYVSTGRERLKLASSGSALYLLAGQRLFRLKMD